VRRQPAKAGRKTRRAGSIKLSERGTKILEMDLDQLEALALKDDRSSALAQLIPGTEDYYFYHALDHLHASRFAPVHELLKIWIQRHGRTGRVLEIERRLALLCAATDPKASFEHIREALRLHFNHQREVEGRVTDYPEALDPQLISRETNDPRAFEQYSNLHAFTDRALDRLFAVKLNAEQRRDLLERLRRPDYPQLVGLILEDLDDEYTGGFGSRPIHQLLLKAQLDELLKKRPSLREETNFVDVYFARLQPSPDVDWENDPQEHLAHLERLWSFAETLSPAFNALKAHILYHRLSFDRSRGIYDLVRFTAYLKLPKRVGYVRREYLEHKERRDHNFSLGTNYFPQTLLPIFRDDTDLVSDLLAHYFLPAGNYDTFKEWVRDDFLKRLYAITKILAGSGDQEKMYSLLDDPAAYQALKERVEIEISPQNPRYFKATDPVSLIVDRKNVPSLVLKVFEINVLAYYRQHKRDVDTSIDLDGLVAGFEQTHQYSDPPLRRVRTIFALELTKPGTYVVEMIGNGRSSRALIRKGKLRYVQRLGAAGHVFTILNEDNQPEPDASLWIDQREYRPKDGEILVPYSTRPRKTQLLLVAGDVTSLDSFDHLAESYTLTAGFYLDRESLIAKRKAELLLRPSLLLNGTAVSLALLENAVLAITSHDHQSIESKIIIPDLVFEDGAEKVVPFQVPENVHSLAFTLSAKVRNISAQSEVDLDAQYRLSLNEIDQSSELTSIFFANTDEGWVLYYLGKTGEPRAHKAVTLQIEHRDYRQRIDVTLQTDEGGRIELGELPEILAIYIDEPNRNTVVWKPEHDRASRPARIHARTDELIELAWPKDQVAPLRAELSLLESRGGGFLRDCFDALTIERGALRLNGLSAGDYDLWLKEEDVHIELKVTAGVVRGTWIASDKRLLERRLRAPLLAEELRVEEHEVLLQLHNFTKETRVHAVATRFAPPHDLLASLALELPGLKSAVLFKSQASYLSGRDIGEEYRYILERKCAVKFPGNNLNRPGLLLNPWAVRKTSSELRDVAAGAAYAAAPGTMGRSIDGGLEGAGEGDDAGQAWNLDFLAAPALLLPNLRPDADGVVRIPRTGLENMSMLRVLVLDVRGVPEIVRTAALPEPAAAHRDLRLRAALDAEAHFIEKKQTTKLVAGEKLIIEDISTSKLERFRQLKDVFRAYEALSKNATLEKFRFVLSWPVLSDAEKRAKYSEFACHELSFFLSRKDPAFFTEVIRPYLQNKRDRTFMDDYLLEKELDPYLEPWAYGRLNILEKILLAQRIQREKDATARHSRDRLDLLPPNVEADARLFDTAIKGSALEVAADSSFEMEKERAIADKVDSASYASLSFGGAVPKAARAEKSKKKMSKGGGGAPPAPSMRARAQEVAEPEPSMDMMEEESSYDDGGASLQDRDVAMREEARPHFRQVEKTEEWAENNYYQLNIRAQGPELLTVNPFWADYAAYDPKEPFTSKHFAHAHRNFTEMMCALAVLDLPLTAKAPLENFSGARMELEAAEQMVVFHQEIKPAVKSSAKSPILVSQNYFRPDDRYSYEGNEHFDKYVTGEMLVHVVYLCQVVLTNPSSSPQKLDILLQIPRGSMPVNTGFVTKGRHIRLAPHETTTIEYHFYFPAPGVFSHFPVQVSKNEELIAHGEPAKLAVVEKLSQVDTTSWAWISQNAESADVLRYLEEHNIDRLNLDLIAWRMADKTFFDSAIALLAKRHVYHDVLWSYAIKHRDFARGGEYLRHQESFLRQAGWALRSPVVDVDPIMRRWFEHLEYAPLINARAHKLGAKTVILDTAFAQQYRWFLEVLTYQPKPGLNELLAATYYLLLQDRVAEAIAMMERVERAGGGETHTQLQRDYLRAYVAFYRGDIAAARAAAEPHRAHPVDRWRKLFDNVLAQLEETSGKAGRVVDGDHRGQRHDQLASTEPALDFTVEQKTLHVSYRNLERCTINYYRMDIELLFSRQPFVQQQSDRFSVIKPNESQLLELPKDRQEYDFQLPAAYHSANVVVELSAGSLHQARANYAHDLGVQVIDQYGQVRISRRATQELLPKVYVKVYARKVGGEVKFYKDGYTDLRGIFDYATLSTNELDSVERFSILIMSEAHGSVIREATPPQR
jgi:hypothetical protein